MPISVTLARRLEEVDPQLRNVLFAILDEIERQREEAVTKNEFRELTAIVGELAEAQKHSQEEMKALRTTMAELAEAQKETRQIVNELAEAQKHSQEEMKALRMTMTELAAAQRETHRQMLEGDQRLESELKKTRTELGGLSESVGLSLEDRALHFLPELLQKDFGFRLETHFIRKWVRDKKGEPLELDFIGEAKKDGARFVIISEAKTHLSKNKIDDFLRKKLQPLAGVYDAEIFPIVMTLKASGIDIEDYALENGIKRVYYSHELTEYSKRTTI